MPKKKNTVTRRPTAASESARFRRENDLRTLQEAETIRSDSGRLRGAKREATTQRRALDRISKR